MDCDLSELQKLIGVQLKGQIVEDKIGKEPNVKVFKRYILSNDSIVLIRMRVGRFPIKVVFPNTYFTQDSYIERYNILVDDNFVVTNIQIG